MPFCMQKETNQGRKISNEQFCPKQQQGLIALEVHLYPNFLWVPLPHGRKSKQGKYKGEG